MRTSLVEKEILCNNLKTEFASLCDAKFEEISDDCDLMSLGGLSKLVSASSVISGVTSSSSEVSDGTFISYCYYCTYSYA